MEGRNVEGGGGGGETTDDDDGMTLSDIPETLVRRLDIEGGENIPSLFLGLGVVGYTSEF